MLAGLIQVIHLIVCVGLIAIVLLQADKGEGLAGAFGGGASSTVFGERGSGGFLSNLTTTLAIVFMITSLIIAVWVPRWEKEAANASFSSQPMVQEPVTAPVQQAVPVDMAAPVAPVVPAVPAAPAAPAVPETPAGTPLPGNG